MTISLGFPTLKSSPQFSTTIHLGTFFPPSLLQEEITQTFQSKIFVLDQDEPTHTLPEKNTTKIKIKNGG